MKTLDDFLHENEEGETLLWPAEADVWQEYFSDKALPVTINLLQNIRDIAMEAGKSESTCFDAREVLDFSNIISALESLLLLHLREQSEVIRNMIPVPDRFCHRGGLYG